MVGCSGRGPTTFMSPIRTLNSWGSSSSRSFRSTRPTGVTLSSSGAAHVWESPAPPGRIVRNLYIVNG